MEADARKQAETLLGLVWTDLVRTVEEIHRLYPIPKAGYLNVYAVVHAQDMFFRVFLGHKQEEIDVCFQMLDNHDKRLGAVMKVPRTLNDLGQPGFMDSIALSHLACRMDLILQTAHEEWVRYVLDSGQAST